MSVTFLQPVSLSRTRTWGTSNKLDSSHNTIHTAIMDTDGIRSNVRRAKSEVEDVKRGLGSLTSFVDMESQHGSYVHSQLNSLKSKLDDAETKLRRVMRELGS